LSARLKPKIRPDLGAAPLKYLVTPLQESDEHHCQCPICGHWVDELDLEEVLQHVDPDHQAPTKS
jgi:hypothetical protein